jgi:hypothetical protein
MTGFVRYECLHKPRAKTTPATEELMDRLRSAIKAGAFQAHTISLEDLLEDDLLSQRLKLGKGELTTIAFAKTTSQAIITDDLDARKLGERVLGSAMTQTTCHLFGWLFYVGRLVDHEKSTILMEHAKMEGNLREHLETAYLMAMQAKLYNS